MEEKMSANESSGNVQKDIVQISNIFLSGRDGKCPIRLDIKESKNKLLMNLRLVALEKVLKDNFFFSYVERYSEIPTWSTINFR